MHSETRKLTIPLRFVMVLCEWFHCQSSIRAFLLILVHRLLILFDKSKDPLRSKFKTNCIKITFQCLKYFCFKNSVGLTMVRFYRGLYFFKTNSVSKILFPSQRQIYSKIRESSFKKRNPSILDATLIPKHPWRWLLLLLNRAFQAFQQSW